MQFFWVEHMNRINITTSITFVLIVDISIIYLITPISLVLILGTSIMHLITSIDLVSKRYTELHILI